MNVSTSTLPYSHTRPRSLRPRSTSITCSARSFSSASRSCGDRLVLLGVAAARARAGDRPRRDAAAGDGDQRLGRGADDLEVLEVEEVHVRRRVDRAQPAVDRERRRRRPRADQRCEGTTWKASPAWTYSTIRATIASNASRGMFGLEARARRRRRRRAAAAGRRAARAPRAIDADARARSRPRRPPPRRRRWRGS